MPQASRFLLLVLSLQLLLTSEAHAYLDPGTGSFIFQMIMAGIVGTAVTLKMYWRQFKALLRRDRGAGAGAGAASKSESSGTT